MVIERLIPLFLAATLAGCFTSTAPVVQSWNIAPQFPERPSGIESTFAVTRIGTVSVLSPYDAQPLTVLRANGSVALDPSNRFAAAPAMLMRENLRAALLSDGRFGNVVGQASRAQADATVEVDVVELALDCSTVRSRYAVVKIDMRVIGGKGAHTILMSSSGEGTINAAAGNYTAAFSAAAEKAFSQALKNLQ